MVEGVPRYISEISQLTKKMWEELDFKTKFICRAFYIMYGFKTKKCLKLGVSRLNGSGKANGEFRAKYALNTSTSR